VTGRLASPWKGWRCIDGSNTNIWGTRVSVGLSPLRQVLAATAAETGWASKSYQQEN